MDLAFPFDLSHAILAGTALLFLWLLFRSARPVEAEAQRVGRLRRELIAMHRGRLELVERAVEAEKKKQPGLKLSQYYERALARQRQMSRR